MAKDQGHTESPPPPGSLPAGGETADIAWDEDTVPRHFDESAFERITAIPELPSEQLAKRLMAASEAGAQGQNDPSSGTFERSESELLTGVGSVPPPTVPVPQAMPAHAQVTLAPPGAIPSDVPGLDLVSLPPVSSPELRDLRDRYAMGDYSGALIIAEAVLEGDPGNIDALRYAKSCRDVLMQMYAARLGPLSQVVSVGIPRDQIRWLSLDHRAGFLLSLVDGRSSLEEILDISGMPRLDALRIMFSLLEERVITLDRAER